MEKQIFFVFVDDFVVNANDVRKRLIGRFVIETVEGFEMRVDFGDISLILIFGIPPSFPPLPIIDAAENRSLLK